jgi:ABC-type sugar transport system ATPase subunit
VADRQLTVGIRPEDIRLSAQGEYRARVHFCEYLGDQYIADLEFKNNLIRAAKLTEPLTVGDDVKFAVFQRNLLLFDPLTGERLTFR